MVMTWKMIFDVPDVNAAISSGSESSTSLPVADETMSDDRQSDDHEGEAEEICREPSLRWSENVL